MKPEHPLHARAAVLIVDDQAVIREGFRSFLGYADDINVVGEAADGEEALERARQLQPDVVLMDVRMPVMDGLTATRLLLEERPATRVIVMTTFDLDEYVYEALRAGASGFLLKDLLADDLVEAVRTVHRGAALLDPNVTRRVIESFVESRPATRTARAADLQMLTQREREVLSLVARGRSNGEIATDLFISEATAKTHVSNLLAKLQLRDRVQAVVLAYETGFIIPR